METENSEIERTIDATTKPWQAASCGSLDYTYKRSARTAYRNFLQNVDYTFRWRKWRLTTRLVVKTLKSLAKPEPTVRQAEIAIDYECDLSCSHCSRTLLMKDAERPLTLEEFGTLYREMHEMGVISFIFTGGEPLHFFDHLLEVIEIFHPSENLISIQSNILLLDDDKAARLKSAGVDIIQASLDLFHAKDGESINFDKAERRLELVRRHGMKMIYVTVVTHQNIHSPLLTAMIQFAKKRGIMLFFNVAIPVGAWGGNDEIPLTDEDQVFLRNLTLRYPHTRFDFAANFGGFGCPAFKERMYITPYGEILGCPFLQISYGSIRNGATLKGARERAMKISHFDHYHDRCLAGEDANFMSTYIPDYDAAKKLPLPCTQMEAHWQESETIKD